MYLCILWPEYCVRCSKQNHTHTHTHTYTHTHTPYLTLCRCTPFSQFIFWGHKPDWWGYRWTVNQEKFNIKCPYIILLSWYVVAGRSGIQIPKICFFSSPSMARQPDPRRLQYFASRYLYPFGLLHSITFSLPHEVRTGSGAQQAANSMRIRVHFTG